MIKVLHLISGGDSGGAKTHIFSLMKGFQGKAKAKIICFIHEDFYDEAKEAGIDIELVEQKSRFDMKAMDRVKKEIQEGDYDLIHCHGARANFNALFLRSSINVPMVTTLHSDYRLDFKDSFIKDKIFTPLNTFALKRFSYYIAITQKFKEMLISRGFPKEKIYVVYNGIDMDSRLGTMEREKFLERFDLTEHKDKTLFVMAARLDQVKDHRTLVKAINENKKSLQDSFFILAGSGMEEEHLKSYIKEHGLENNVRLIGELKDPENLFAAGDVNLLTSKSESFPYALMEGARENLAFVASKVGGIPEMAGKNQDYLFEPGNAQELGEILVRINNHPEQLKERGVALNQYVREHFSAESMAKKHIEIYEDIIKKDGGKN
ncbi:glycosyltransferase [Peptoniphilus sp. KCTC 25270]|uniref:glycosyltransferase n=1 Tax=Peptoniphilus sp. KCTC 25270 TaxID=2897414 RepID=UPI001E2A6708|nr:glycosyltransferase [Peptoniphilus sp. KCTC 25270]MCD1146783.1 glycosyltransferase [Peptoniphilus sp. KCTC 25270]